MYKKSNLDIDDPGKLLDAVQQQIPLLHNSLVLPVLAVRAVGLHNAPNLVYLAVQVPARYEPRQLSGGRYRVNA